MKTVSVEKYKQAGQTRVPACGFLFVIQRPTIAEVYNAGGAKVSLDFVAKHIVGWESVKESDLLPGGDPEPVSFDSELMAAWLSDRADLWSPLTEAVIESFKAYEEAQAARGKP